MAKPGGATKEKRDRERARQERQAEKREDRVRRKEERETHRAANPNAQEEDPDIAGIVPGPQPQRDDD